MRFRVWASWAYCQLGQIMIRYATPVSGRVPQQIHNYPVSAYPHRRWIWLTPPFLRPFCFFVFPLLSEPSSMKLSFLPASCKACFIFPSEKPANWPQIQWAFNSSIKQNHLFFILTLRSWKYIVPSKLYFRHRSDIRTCDQHKLVKNIPFWLIIQPTGWMKRCNLWEKREKNTIDIK